MKTTRQIFEQIDRLQQIAENLEERSAINAQIDVLASLLTCDEVTAKYQSHARTAAYAALTWLRRGGPDLADAWEATLLVAA